MTVSGCGLIFQTVLLACTYNNDTIMTFQKKKIDITGFYQSLHTQKSRQNKQRYVTWH